MLQLIVMWWDAVKASCDTDPQNSAGTSKGFWVKHFSSLTNHDTTGYLMCHRFLRRTHCFIIRVHKPKRLKTTVLKERNLMIQCENFAFAAANNKQKREKSQCDTLKNSQSLVVQKSVHNQQPPCWLSLLLYRQESMSSLILAQKSALSAPW